MWEAKIKPQVKNRYARSITAVLVMMALMSIESPAEAQDVPVNLQAAIFFKVLSYDSAISSKDGSDITIYVITDGKTAGNKGAMVAGFGKLTGKKLGGKTIKIKAIGVGEAAGVAGGNAILYVPDGASAGTISTIIAIAAQKKCATLGGSEALAKKGLAVGLGIENGKPQIVINFPASQKQGMKLSSKVLRLAKVIK